MDDPELVEFATGLSGLARDDQADALVRAPAFRRSGPGPLTSAAAGTARTAGHDDFLTWCGA
ncbi:MAG: hypothetical protein ACRDP6_06610 [Actinoallomurus sp.]